MWRETSLEKEMEICLPKALCDDEGAFLDPLSSGYLRVIREQMARKPSELRNICLEINT